MLTEADDTAGTLVEGRRRQEIGNRKSNKEKNEGLNAVEESFGNKQIRKLTAILTQLAIWKTQFKEVMAVMEANAVKKEDLSLESTAPEVTEENEKVKAVQEARGALVTQGSRGAMGARGGGDTAAG